MTYNGLPLFNLDVLTDEEGIKIISLVTNPAVQREFVCFNANEEVKFSLDEERRVLTGVALIPDQKIYRKTEDGKEFFVQFSREAIERAAQKFFSDRNSTNVNLQHTYDVDGCVYFESYLIDHNRGIAPVEFSDLPDGTWIVSCKVNNDEVWRLVKEGVLRGFSIEGDMDIKSNETKVIDSIEDLIAYITNN